VAIGLAQALAILPGISRSGASIAAAVRGGIQREAAARYSFLLSIPIVAGAGALQLASLLRAGNLSEQLGVLLIGFFSAAVVGYLAIHALLLLVGRRPLYPFAAYCLLLGVVSLSLYVVRG
jgi:undecaprenyl-diphosphatase